ncbi:MAG: ATP-binding cassette domain-containing protein [Gammaproteobacteria bacterium]|nr:ATP-binding cassette domain-containing protein [Gammaproteobacteria bacterium]
MTVPVIDINDLEFSWAKDRPLIQIERLAINAGERVFVHGPSGSGKSSLLSLLAGVVVPQQGRMKVLDTELAKLPAAARDRFRADHIGVIFQMFNLVPYLSIVENITLPCRFSSRRRERVTARGGADDEARRLLEHLDLAEAASSERAVTRLSVGQQQRVAAARALIGGPEIVLADEPTSALDSDRREAFLKLLFRECGEQRTTLLFVSHDINLQRLFDRTVALHDINRAAVQREDTND